MPDEAAGTREAILARAASISKVLEATVFIFLFAAIARATGADALNLQGVQIKPALIPIVAVALTAAHIYTAYLFSAKVKEILASQHDEMAKIAFQALNDKGPLFFRGVISRLEIKGTGSVLGMRWRSFRTPLSDPTTLLAHVAAAGVFVVMVWWGTKLEWFWQVLNAIFSLFIIATNWTVGASWMIAAYCLDDPERGRTILRVHNSTQMSTFEKS